jgi:catechol 2,3-dioxygenase-like lactoylglutathione lyase family enzyme
MTGKQLQWPNWIGLVVRDLEGQRGFYRDVLGFSEMAADADWVQFDLGWPNLLELIRVGSAPQYDRPRYQPGFAVDDIHAARERLVAQGVEAISGVEGDAAAGGHWCYFRDPEGNVFEISQRLGAGWSSSG